MQNAALLFLRAKGGGKHFSWAENTRKKTVHFNHVVKEGRTVIYLSF